MEANTLLLYLWEGRQQFRRPTETLLATAIWGWFTTSSTVGSRKFPCLCRFMRPAGRTKSLLCYGRVIRRPLGPRPIPTIQKRATWLDISHHVPAFRCLNQACHLSTPLTLRLRLGSFAG